MPSPYYSATQPAADLETFEATVGPGQTFADLDEANTVFVASGFPQARFFLAGTVPVGADITMAESVELIGFDDSPTLDLDGDINTGTAGSTLASVYKFKNLHIRVVSGKRISVKDTALRFEFDGCNLDNTSTSAGQVLSMTVAGVVAIVCRQCVLTDDKGSSNGLFQNQAAATMDLFLEGCTEAGGSTGAYVYRDTSGSAVGNIYFLDGTKIRDHVMTGTGTVNIHQDGSSTFDLSNNTITTTNLNRLGTAGFNGTYTGDGTTSLTVSGWDFDTRFVKIWERKTVSASDTFAYETTPEINDDIAGGAAVFSASSGVFAPRIVSVGFGQFVVTDNGADFPPNTSGEVYNFRVEG